MADTSDYVTDTGDADLAHDPQIAEEDWDRELNNQPVCCFSDLLIFRSVCAIRVSLGCPSIPSVGYT